MTQARITFEQYAAGESLSNVAPTEGSGFGLLSAGAQASTDRAYSGTKSMKVTTAQVQLVTVGGGYTEDTGNNVWVDVMMWFAAFPSANRLLIGGSSGTTFAGLGVSPAGVPFLTYDSGATKIETGPALPLGQWVRIAAKTCGGGGVQEARMWTSDHTAGTPTTRLRGDCVGGGFLAIAAGRVGGNYIDDIIIKPALDGPVTR